MKVNKIKPAGVGLLFVQAKITSKITQIALRFTVVQVILVERFFFFNRRFQYAHSYLFSYKGKRQPRSLKGA